MIRVKKIAHVSYQMPEVEQQAEYYANVLGMTVAAKERSEERRVGKECRL